MTLNQTIGATRGKHVSEPMKHLSINKNRPFYSLPNWSAKLMIGLMCISIAVFALVATGRTSTGIEKPRQTPDPSAPFLAPSSAKILVDSDIPPDYSPIAVVRINGDLFQKVELRNAPRALTPGSGGGSAEVFDSNGRLLRRFTAVERANSTWKVVEYIRLSPPTATPSAPASANEPMTTRQQ